MELGYSILTLVSIVAIASYKRANLLLTAAVICIAAATGTFMGYTPVALTVSVVVFFALVSLPFIRRAILSKPMFGLYKSIMPEMSSTEKDAINAGSVWWDGELFSGRPDWKKIHDYGHGVLSEEEKAFLSGPVETVCNMADEWEINHKNADLPPEIWQYLKDNKFFAMIIKKEFGGLEFSAYAQSRVLQKISGSSIVLASTVGVPNSLGPGELLQHYGTKQQQEHYLPRLAVGQDVPCFALTSPEAGSDAGAIPDTGIVCKGMWNGEEVLGMKITCNKRYITLAPIATVVGLAIKLKDPEGLLGDTKDIGITCALIPRDTDGLKIGRRHFPLNIPFMNGPIQANDMFVPLDYIIGGAAMAGQGWRMLVECLSVGRCITLPSNSAGGAKTVALASGAYSRIRRQFRLPIGQMEGVEEMLGRMGANAYLMDAVTSMTMVALDNGEKPSVISAICKYHLTEKMRQVVNDAMDVHGGKGICLGPTNYLGRAYQGAPIAITVEGANILTRNMMIYGQGAIRCHPFVLKEMLAIQIEDKKQALSEFDNAVFGHVGFALSNTMRSLWASFTGTRLLSSPVSDETAKYYRAMQTYSANLALLSDMSMALLGGSLKRKERISARLGDMLSYLYLGSAVLHRYHTQGRNKDELIFVHWCMQDCLNKLEDSMVSLLENYPSKIVGSVLRRIVLPFGKRYTAPSDKLDHKIAVVLQNPSDLRDRLGEGQHLAADEGNLAGQLEKALVDMVACEPLFDKVVKASGERLPFLALDKVAEKGLALGVITEQEAQLMRDTEVARLAVINVDDFDTRELMIGADTQPADVMPQENVA
jgi:acyl-CoA dehydrogenase